MQPGRPKRSELNRILNEANVSGEYEPLRYAFADILHGSIDATSAVQQQVAFEVNKVYKGAYKAYQGRGGSGSYEEYLNMPGVQGDLGHQPVDLSLLASTPLHKGAAAGATFGWKYEGLSAVKTVQQANSWLASTMLPAMLVEASQMEDEGRGTMDFVGAGVIGLMEALPGYIPGKSNPSLFMARAGAQGIRNAARADRDMVSIDASPNGFFEGDQFLGNPGMATSPEPPHQASINIFNEMQIDQQHHFGKYTPTNINPLSPFGIANAAMSPASQFRPGDKITNLGFAMRGADDEKGTPETQQMAYDALDLLSSGGNLDVMVQRRVRPANTQQAFDMNFSVRVQGMTPTRMMEPDAKIPFFQRLLTNMGENALPTPFYVPGGGPSAGIGGALLINDNPGVKGNDSFYRAAYGLSRTQKPGYVQAWITPNDVNIIGKQIASGMNFDTPERSMLREALNTASRMFVGSSRIDVDAAGSSIEKFEDLVLSSTRQTYETSTVFGNTNDPKSVVGGTVTIPPWMAQKQAWSQYLDMVLDPGNPKMARAKYDGGSPASYPYDYMTPYKFESGPGRGDSMPWFPGAHGRTPTEGPTVSEADQPFEGTWGAPNTVRNEWAGIEGGSDRSLLYRQNGAYAAALSLIPNARGFGSFGTQLAGMAKRGFVGYVQNDLIPIKSVAKNEFNMAVSGKGGAESLNGRRGWMRAQLDQLAGRNPALAARARYIGFNEGKEVDGENLDQRFTLGVDALNQEFERQAAENSEAQKFTLNYDPKHPDAFGRQYEAIRNTNPQAAARIAEVLDMPNEEKVFNTLKKLSGKAPQPPMPEVFGTENSPTPARNNVNENFNIAARNGRSGIRSMNQTMNGGPLIPDDMEGRRRPVDLDEITTSPVFAADPVYGPQPAPPTPAMDAYLDARAAASGTGRVSNEAMGNSWRDIYQQVTARGGSGTLNIFAREGEPLNDQMWAAHREFAASAGYTLGPVSYSPSAGTSSASLKFTGARTRHPPPGGYGSDQTGPGRPAMTADDFNSGEVDGFNEEVAPNHDPVRSRGHVHAPPGMPSCASHPELYNAERFVKEYNEPTEGSVLEGVTVGSWDNKEGRAFRARAGISTNGKTIWMEGGREYSGGLPMTGHVSDPNGNMIAAVRNSKDDVEMEENKYHSRKNKEFSDAEAARVAADRADNNARGAEVDMNDPAVARRMLRNGEIQRLGNGLGAGLNAHSINGFNDPMYGEGQVGYGLDTEGKNVPKTWNVEKGGRETISMGTINSARNVAAGAIANATQGALPAEGVDAAATIRKRINDFISNSTKDLTEEMAKREGISPSTAKAVSEAREAVAKHLVKGAEALLVDAASGGDDRAANVAPFRSIPLRGVDAIKSAAEGNAILKGKLTATGLTHEQLASGPSMTFMAEQEGTPAAFTVGGEGGDFAPREKGAAGMFGGGRFGSMLYGAYIAKRMWGMTTQPFIQDATIYAASAQDYGNIGAMGGGSIGLASTYTARAARAKEAMGKSAYEVFGGAMDIATMGSGGAAGRLLTEGGMGLEVAATTAIGAQMFGIGATTALAPGLLPGLTVGGAGLAAGAAIVGGGLAIEGMNALGLSQSMGYGKAITPTGIWNSLRAASIFDAANGRATKALPGGMGGVIRDANGKETGRISPNNDQITAQMSDQDKAWLQSYYSNAAPEQRIEDLAGVASGRVNQAPDQVRGGIRELNRLFGSGLDTAMVNKVSDAALGSGLGWDNQISSGSQYASITGNLEGSTGFKEAFDKWTQLSSGGALAQAQASFSAQRYAQLGSQVQDAMPISMQGWGTRLATRSGIETQQQMGVWSQMGNAAQAGGRSINATQWGTLADYARTANPMVAGVISNAGALVSQQGGNGYGVEQSLMGGNINPRYANTIAASFSGNLGAASFMSWQQGDSGSAMLRMYDQSGMAIGNTNGDAAMSAAADWAAMGVQSANFGTQNIPGINQNTGAGGQATSTAAMSNTARAQQLFGSTDKGLINSFLNGGMQGAQAYQRMKSEESQLASIGVQGAGIALQSAYLWGSGNWANPGAGSSWDIENQQIANAHSTQEWEFSQQSKQMQMSNSYAKATEKNQYQHMEVSQAYNAYQQDFNRTQQVQSKQWTQQDWQYQATTRELNYGWSTEDLNEQIRYSSGRERRDLIRQKDRAALSYNLEGEQVVTSQDRQKTLWAEQDEQYKKQVGYTANLNRLDLDAYNLQKKYREDNNKMETENISRRKKDYEKEYELEGAARTLSRKYQSDQIDLQKASLGVQAEQIKQQYTLNEAITKGSQGLDKWAGEVGQIAQYDQVLQVMIGLRTLTGDLNQLDTDKMTALKTAITAFGSIDINKMKALDYLLSQLTP